LLTEPEDPKKICKTLYEKNLNTGLYHSTRTKQDAFLSTIYKEITEQKQIIEKCKEIRNALIFRNKQKKFSNIQELAHCSLDPTNAIKLCLAA